MSLGHGQHQIDPIDFELGQVIICVGNGKQETCIQLARPDALDLLQGTEWLELQFHVRLPFSKLPERVWNYSMPGYALNESHAQCSCLTGRHTLGASCRLIHLLKNTSRILQKQLARRANFDSA